MWTNEQRDAPVAYLLKKISLDDLLKALALEPGQVIDECRRQFQLAIAGKDGRLVEAAWYVMGIFNVPAVDYLDLICVLLDEDWHYQHEDMIGRLQGIADPLTIPTIKRAIDLKPRLKYLEYDDYGSYYKKCLWALQAIGTTEAIAVIEECLHAEDEALHEQAAYRLSKIKRSMGTA